MPQSSNSFLDLIRWKHVAFVGMLASLILLGALYRSLFPDAPESGMLLVAITSGLIGAALAQLVDKLLGRHEQILDLRERVVWIGMVGFVLAYGLAGLLFWRDLDQQADQPRRDALAAAEERQRQRRVEVTEQFQESVGGKSLDEIRAELEARRQAQLEKANPVADAAGPSTTAE